MGGWEEERKKYREKKRKDKRKRGQGVSERFFQATKISNLESCKIISLKSRRRKSYKLVTFLTRNKSPPPLPASSSP